MSSFHVFAGPYLEILAPLETFPEDINWSEEEYDTYFSTSARLRWIRGRGDPEPIEIAGRIVWQHCGFPQREEIGIPRWPMYFCMEGWRSGENAVVDLRGADVAAEVAWFEQAFAVELDFVTRAAVVYKFDWGVHWGMVSYVY